MRLKTKSRKVAISSSRIVLSVVFVLIALLAVLAVPSTADAQVDLGISPADTCVIAGSIFELDVYIDSGAVNLMGWNITIGYDSTLLAVVDVLEGTLPADSGHPTFFSWLNEGEDDDFIFVNGSILGKTVDSPGVLVTIVFEALKVGNCEICIDDSDLRNNLNRSITHTRSCGNLMIEEPIGTEPATWGRIKKLGEI